jgi:hypothetical protein
MEWERGGGFRRRTPSERSYFSDASQNETLHHLVKRDDDVDSCFLAEEIEEMYACFEDQW